MRIIRSHFAVVLLIAVVFLLGPLSYAFPKESKSTDLQAEVDQLRTEVRSLLRVSLSSHLREVLHRVNASEGITAKKKREYSATLLGCIHAVLADKPIDSSDIRPIIHAINVANIGAASKVGVSPNNLKSCLQECDDAYDSAVANCNGISDSFEKEYCLNQAIEASSACQDNCQQQNSN